MNVNPNIIKRSLYRNTRYALEFFMYEPSIENWKTVYNINVNPILNFIQLNSGSNKEDFSTIKERTYRITPRNLYRTLKFFNRILEWFHDNDKKDLFLINDDNELVFNSDYSKLSLTTPKSLNEDCVMKAMPAVIVFNEKRYEGIYLYINKTSNLISLTRDEIEMLLGFLKDFSFQDEIITCLEIMRYSKERNMINTGGGWQSKKSPFD